MEEMDWNMASNSQLKDEYNRLNGEFQTKQEEMKTIIGRFETLNNEMRDLSKSFIEIKNILDKREGKKK